MPESDVLKQSKEISRIVNIAAVHGMYNAGCLRRSLLIWWLLRRDGIISEIYFGVRKLNGKLEAHAWVAYHNIILNDTENISELYQVLQNTVPPVKLML